MKLKTIEANNEMIAEFMNVDKVDIDTWLETESNLLYHKSWDWLMPVVVKIKGMNIEDEEMFNEIDFYATSSIENLYSAVVRFIEWVNEN